MSSSINTIYEKIVEGVWLWRISGGYLQVIKVLWIKSCVSTERYAHLSDEETIETVESVSKRLYGYVVLNADKNAAKMDFEKTLNCKSLLLFAEMDASLVGAPDFKPECTALTLS